MDRTIRLIAWTLGAWLFTLHAAASANTRCSPAAIISGGDELVGEVVSELETHGIDVNPPAGCPRLRVELTREDGQIVVDVTDPAARRIRRSVSRVGEVVTVIESWARPDMNADLLEGFDVPPAVPTPPLAPTQVATLPDTTVPPSVARSQIPSTSAVVTQAMTEVRREERSPLTVSVLGDIGIDRRSTWFGTMVTACTPLWRICVGGTGHVQTSTSVDVPSEAALLATVDMPFRVRQLRLIPGLSFGAGRNTSSITSGMQNQPDSGWSPRAEARLVASYPLARRVFVDLLMGVVGASSNDQQNQNQNSSGLSTGLAPLFELGAGLRVGAP